MGKRSTAAYNPTLTNYAQGLSQDLSSALAEFIAPTVVVGAGIGQYKSYSEKNHFQAYDTARAIGGPATRIKMDASDPTYNCKPQALEIPIDDHEYDAAGEGEPSSRLQEAKVRTLIQAATLSHEDKVLAAIKAATTAVAGKGVWSDPDVDPIKEIDEQIKNLADACGRMPNRLALGVSTWNVLRNHPKVIARQPGAALIGLTIAQLSQMLMNPVEVKIGVLSKDATKFGATKNAASIVGADLFLFFAAATPDTYDASFAKTFMTRLGSVDSVRTYRSESDRSEIIAVDWSEDIKVTSSSSGVKLTIS